MSEDNWMDNAARRMLMQRLPKPEDNPNHIAYYLKAVSEATNRAKMHNGARTLTLVVACPKENVGAVKAILEERRVLGLLGLRVTVRSFSLYEAATVWDISYQELPVLWGPAP